MYTIVLLIEKVMDAEDVGLVTSLHEGVETSFVVVLPGKADHHRLVRALDDVALGHLEEAAEDVEHPAADDAADVTRRTLDVSVANLTAVGVRAVGETAPGDDPLQILKDIVERHAADEVIVLTAPHLIEEFFHRDWASRARHRVGVPVLKLFAHNTP
ncbi:indole-3-glycerol phosphate synthase [Yinghuangia sp. ASG 101]|uniref:indole-3-glycerol phosphate synthase n=1 Tax=Yinghuangia sp. ASG 101 TaxID=2896848 RepID=UPI001E34C5B8|nr:indole-3-glycerol phosphate synthase [Yinghuangia sp. ASG 101]UGQ13780.1 indole-3-glycerol phosphate synthase [Yinghuangia sp. ASG 101]